MGSDGPGITHGIAYWMYPSPPPAERDTRAAARKLYGKQKLEAALAQNPHLRVKADKLTAQGWDAWKILDHFKLARKQFAFANGIGPPPNRRYRPKWD